MPERDESKERSLARRPRPVSGPVEDYRPEPEGEDDDGPSAADVARFGDVTVKCPECGTELFDDVAICWQCGRALGASGDAKGPPMWAVIVVVVLVALLAMGYVAGVLR